MIRQLILASALLLSGCCVCPEMPQPRSQREPRLGDVAAIRSSLGPLLNLDSAAFISSTLWVETTNLQPGPGFKNPISIQAAYARQDMIAFLPGTDAPSLAHEVLHAFWEHNLVPDRDTFLETLEIVQTGTSDHQSYIREFLNDLDARLKRDYADDTYDTEMYAYLGNLIMRDGDFCIPEIILRHYQGVLNPSILARRVCARSE